MIGYHLFVIGKLYFVYPIISSGSFRHAKNIQSLKGAFAEAKAFHSKRKKSSPANPAVELFCFIHTYNTNPAFSLCSQEPPVP